MVAGLLCLKFAIRSMYHWKLRTTQTFDICYLPKIIGTYGYDVDIQTQL